jgi:hypothetical protein
VAHALAAPVCDDVSDGLLDVHVTTFMRGRGTTIRKAAVTAQ